MTVTASKLREDIYRILDQILKTGRPVEITRKGKRLRIVPVEPVSKLSRLKTRAYLLRDPEELVHMDWTHEWHDALP